MKTPLLSVLDLAPILSGFTASASFAFTTALAQRVEAMGYHRYWFAEHHDMEGIGSSAPEVLIAHVASCTENIRVGSGGIMLPNHATLHVAEIFKTLEALYPGRIDFGLGRAPGSGSKAANLLRGQGNIAAQEFPHEFDKLVKWLNDDNHNDVAAVPSDTPMPEIWILGSSDFGAQFAADRGFPYAFAQHFSHLPALEIIRLYHERFRPSEFCKKPKASLGCHIICAETDEAAEELALSSDLSFALFIGTGRSIPLPSVAEAKAYPFTPQDWNEVRKGSMPKFVGSPETIKKMLRPYLESGLIDELMILSMIHDPLKRMRSYELVSQIWPQN